MKFRVPLRTASIFRILSPEFRRSLMVPMMGNPAPTFVSKRNFTPRLKAVSFNRAYSSYCEEAAILLAATTLTLCSKRLW